MGNFKVRVNSEAESKEIQNILESIGFRKWDAWSEPGSIGGFIWTDSDMTYCDNGIEHFDESPREEITLPELRAMVNPMKEYLNENTYEYKLACSKPDGGWVEIPKNANYAGSVGHGVFFSEEKEFMPKHVVWVRPTQPEALPLIGDNPQSINNQYAEIEQVRQHRHYFIDVSDVDEVDFYEIALRYNVIDPCIQHILKKCLAVGQRGQKDFHHDLKDIYDTAKRMLDVHGLDS